MREVICGVDNAKCNIEMCKSCKKYSQEVIDNALREKRNELLKIEEEFNKFCDNVNRKYIPSCEYGYEDCIYDREYISTHYPEWLKELEKDGPYDCSNCNNGDQYDDEDK